MATSFFRRFTKGFFVLCNIIVAILFLLSCYASYFNPTYFWPLGFLNLASIYFLIVLVIFIVFWLFAKFKMMLISIIAILLCYSPLKNLIKLPATNTFTKAKTTGSIRIMSWNIEHFDILEHKTHPERKQQMLKLIIDNEPDVACFQEMVGSEKPTAINYTDEIGKQINMLNYHYSYNTLSDFDADHHFGIITFSKYPIVNKHTISYAPNTYNNIFQYIDIVKNGDTIRIFNIHLQSLKFSNTNLAYIDDPTIKTEVDIQKSKNLISKFKRGFLERKKQADRIQKTINESPYPVIVCGDLNDVPNSYAYCTIGKNLKNIYTEKGSGIGRTFSNISPTLRIDNIFVDNKMQVEQYTRIKKKISDHYPIIGDIILTKK